MGGVGVDWEKFVKYQVQNAYYNKIGKLLVSLFIEQEKLHNFQIMKL